MLRIIGNILGKFQRLLLMLAGYAAKQQQADHYLSKSKFEAKFILALVYKDKNVQRL